MKENLLKYKQRTSGLVISMPITNHYVGIKCRKMKSIDILVFYQILTNTFNPYAPEFKHAYMFKDWLTIIEYAFQH